MEMVVVVCFYIDRFQWTRVDNVVASRRKEEKKSRTFCRRRRRSNAAMTNASGRCVGREKAPRAAQLTHERPYQISRGRKRVGWCWLVFF